jgi:hypothetical protein
MCCTARSGQTGQGGAKHKQLSHYHELYALVQLKCAELGGQLPIIATGHLHRAGSAVFSTVAFGARLVSGIVGGDQRGGGATGLAGGAG